MNVMPQSEQSRLIASVATVVIGIALILLAELAHWEWTRIFGAVLILTGGLIAGVVIGLAPPRRRFVVDWLDNRRAIVAAVVAVLLVLPVLLSLLGVFVGLADEAGAEGGSLRSIGGVVLGVIFLLGSTGSLWLSIRSFRRAQHLAEHPPGQVTGAHPDAED